VGGIGGAEGATAPETLRQKDRGGMAALESDRQDLSTDEVSRPFGW
jgi:hypothetical protein